MKGATPPQIPALYTEVLKCFKNTSHSKMKTLLKVIKTSYFFFFLRLQNPEGFCYFENTKINVCFKTYGEGTKNLKRSSPSPNQGLLRQYN